MWQFWIDVGGTFTDCVGQSPQGVVRQTKVLSSGLFKGNLRLSDRHDATRMEEPSRFWDGAKLTLLDAAGERVWASQVRFFEGGQFQFDEAVPVSLCEQHETLPYELDAGQHAPLMAIRRLMGLPIDQPIPACGVHLGTTRGTNALLTRSGSRTALLTSRGFKDFLTIGDQARPNLFELAIHKLTPLFEASLAIDERVLADGTVERQPNESVVREQLRALRTAGIESIAVCLVHGYRYPRHEQQIGQLAREMGFSDVRLSHEVSPLIKLIPRGETTVLDAYLNPVIGLYLDQIEAGLGQGSYLQLMTSAGGMVGRSQFSGKDSVLSGPAGGVVGAARVAAQFGFDKVIGFDMGGTSTDVSRYESIDGHDSFEREYESRKAGVRIVAPMMAVETVAAGGGSVCWFDGVKLCVGPKSTGADPGPACYGKGGPLAITDMNFFLGRISQSQFPFPLDRAAVVEKIQQLCDQLAAAEFNYSPTQLAEGFVRIANQNMANAIASVSVSKGYDPSDHVLMSFGGAGSQHCCGVADNLEIGEILDHPQSSILSAVGIRLADRVSHMTQAVDERLDDQLPERVEPALKEMELRAVEQLESEGVAKRSIRLQRRLDIRFSGTEHFLTIDQPADLDYRTSFRRQHNQRYGYVQDRPIEVVALRVEAISLGNRLNPVAIPTQFFKRQAMRFQPMSFAGVVVQGGCFQRSEVATGDAIEGPAIITDTHSTTIIDPGWMAKAIGEGAFLIERRLEHRSQLKTNDNKTYQNKMEESLPTDDRVVSSADPTQLEIFNSHFSSIAKQMGIALQLTSVSVNVKERLDFSCAIFTATGDLVVNAPHIPVHLGAMSETVREVIRRNENVSAGDAFVTNDPYAGGSHLPDVTVISPVFSTDGQELLFWVASRSHHAEIGGKAPGSMPADARFLSEEGVLIDNFKLIEAGVERFEQLRAILSAPPYPSRNVDENLADLAAQVAANRAGMRDLLTLVDRHSRETVQQYMDFIQQAAAHKARAAISKLPDQAMACRDQLDNGATIAVSIKKTGDRLAIDFSGTDLATGDNLNANAAIVSSAVMYVVRCLVAEDIPLNEGLLQPISVHVPDCLLNPRAGDRHPHNSPAMVGGNVETSQRVVDVLLGALGVAAASQGTMNNWLIGNDTFGYYETVGGGSGATCGANGVDAVHTHMTNTRLTDPEILETKYPCVLRDFSIRPNSGGQGAKSGGCGMVREIEFTRPLTLSLLTGRRNSRPYGVAGGESGQPGLNQLLSEDGSVRSLPWRCEWRVLPGQRLRIETPGGGGFGTP